MVESYPGYDDGIGLQCSSMSCLIWWCLR